MSENKVAVREQVIDFLRRELVGPDPIAPFVQANGEEILVNDPPRLRYGAGVLFPQEALIEEASDAAPGEDTEIPLDDVIEEADEGPPVLPEGLEGAAIDEAEADEVISLSNAFLPSAMGFSCLAEIPQEGLHIQVRAAVYRPRDVFVTNKEGKEYKRKYYDRAPFEAKLVVPYQQLTDAGVVSFGLPVVGEGVLPGLCVRVLSRPTKRGAPCRLLTLSLVNTLTSGRRAENEKCFFQVEMQVQAADGSAPFREYPDAGLRPDDEEKSLALLYRHRKTYGIGHGCAAHWDEVDQEKGHAHAICCDVLPVHEIKPIVPARFDDLTLSMLELSDLRPEENITPLVTRLCEKYADWIGRQQATVDKADFPAEHKPAALRHLQACRVCLTRMKSGVAILQSDALVRRAFRLSNRAMLRQQLHYALGTDPQQARSWRRDDNGVPTIAPPAWPDLENPPTGKGLWYPFQLAFLLMNLHSLAEPQHDERNIVDLIWFPTGGGKTEAYLGLTAFTIILRRLRHSKDAGTAVLMRYTLRLLTAQQFQRAASLICALELMRRDRDLPGEAPITIGLWAGGDLTPNKRADAKITLKQMASGEVRDNKFVVLNCPWCGAKMGPVEINKAPDIIGYESTRSTVIFSCKDPLCAFADPQRLPLTVIDEDLYDTPPTLLLGTVDKFAMLPWQPDARAFFGLKENGAGLKTAPPDLIIQDELHLISGPLGSMVGHYETVIQELCTRHETGFDIGPKIVASTATISRAAEQCHALWNCGKESVFQFPPQCLQAGDSFFAKEDTTKPGRKYLGVHASALGSHVTAQVRVMSALLQAPLSANVQGEKERDPYWTLIGYFNSLRELGQAATLVNAEIKEYLNRLYMRVGLGQPEEGKRDYRRFIYRDLELTGRIASGRVAESLGQLFVPYQWPMSPERDYPVDVCLATSMIEVGVDVPRLGLMVVAGQPKTTATYIQATSRVGRSDEGPGLAVMVYNTQKPRDRSHYEHFHSYHGSIYKAVEPTSVTPFSSPVRDRALHAILTTLVRYRGSAANRNKPQPFPEETLWREIEAIVEKRVRGVDPAEEKETMQLLRERIAHWERVLPPDYGKFGLPPDNLPLMYQAGSEPAASWEEKSWPMPTSMRDVDASCEAKVIGSYPQPGGDETEEETNNVL